MDDRPVAYVKTYSTRQAARKAEINRVTLQDWVTKGKVRPSQIIGLNGGKQYRWTDEDIRKIIEYKKENYGKGRGRRTDLKKKDRKK